MATQRVQSAAARAAQAKAYAQMMATKAVYQKDLVTVTTAFTSTMLFDYEEIGRIVNAYAGKDEFVALRIACFELAVKASLIKAGEECDDARALEIAKHNGTVKGARTLTDPEKDAKKSARNKWFGFTEKCGIITQEARGGANNTDGKNGATGKGKGRPKGKGKPKGESPDTDDDDEDIADAPITLHSVVVEKLPSLMDLSAHYVSLKFHLIKLQKANAKVYTGDEGGKLLSRHQRIIAILNEA